MLTWLHSLLGGSSPITGYLGSILMVMDLVKQLFVDRGLPQDTAGWIGFVGAFITGLALRFAKDGNKSNAPHPTDTPTTVG